MCSLPKCLDCRRYSDDLIIAPDARQREPPGQVTGTSTGAGLIQQAAGTGPAA
jgi:hypothetical protein